MLLSGHFPQRLKSSPLIMNDERTKNTMNLRGESFQGLVSVISKLVHACFSLHISNIKITRMIRNTLTCFFQEIHKTRMCNQAYWGNEIPFLTVIYSFRLLPFPSVFHSISLEKHCTIVWWNLQCSPESVSMDYINELTWFIAETQVYVFLNYWVLFVLLTFVS